MSSATSTERGPSIRDGHDAASGFQLWHLYMLLAMAGATAAVIVSPNTHPLALVLLSAAVLAAGFVGLTLHRALASFFFGGPDPAPIGTHARDALEREKALVLRSIKELEFDHAMGKISEPDFANIGGRLRARALTLMQDLARQDSAPLGGKPSVGGRPPVESKPPVADKPPIVDLPPLGGRHCIECGTANEPDARFCKHCGRRVDGLGRP